MTTIAATSPILGAAQPKSPHNMAAIDKTAKEFEAMFLSEMLSHMFEGIDTDPMFGGGHGEEMFRSMLVSEYGKMIADGGGLGVSDSIRKTMIEIQENNSK